MATNAQQKAQQKEERLAHANALIQIIASHGHRFFYLETVSARAAVLHRVSGYTGGNISQLELRRGKVFFLDSYSGKAVYTHKTTWANRWTGFSNGGTLRSLVENLRDYVLTGTHLSPWKIGLPRTKDGSLANNTWGYEESALQKVRDAAFALPLFAPPA
jgi:hypothetical protein